MAYEAEKRIILSHQAVLAQVRSRIDAYALRVWNGLGSWRDSDIDRFVAKVVPLIESGQKQTAQLTSAYLDSIARLAGMPIPPKAALATELRGVPLVEVYRRPAETLYYQLSEGKTLDEAVSLGGQRLSTLISTDMQMANVRQSFARLSGDRHAIGYMRVLGGGETCALCALASTQMYHTDQLMEIHDRCNCGVETVYETTRDAVESLASERYGDAMQQIGEANVENPKLGANSTWEVSNKPNSHIRVNIHGEVGPVLGWADQAFRSAADL